MADPTQRWLERADELGERLVRGVALGRWSWLLLGLGLVVPALYAGSPQVLVNTMPLDIFVPLDGGWRVLQGQVPHVDFHTPVGRLYYDAYALAMRWLATDARVILWVPALCFPLVAGATLIGTWGRLPALLRVLFALALGYTTASPVHQDLTGLAHLAFYNRVGWALVTVVLLASALPRTHPSRWGERIDAGLCALLVTALFYVKITYFMLGGLGLLLAVALEPANRRWALAAGVATWAALGLDFATSEVPWAYVADLRAAGASYDPEWARISADRAPGLQKLVTDLVTNGWALVVAMGGLVVLSRTSVGVEEEVQANRSGLLGLALIAATLLVGVQSHDHANPGLLAAAALPFGAALGRALRSEQAVRYRRFVLVCTLALCAVTLPAIGRHGLGMVSHRVFASSDRSDVVAAARRDHVPAARLRFVSPGGLEAAPLAFLRDQALTPELYRELVPEVSWADLVVLLSAGEEALQQHAPPHTKSLALMFTSPFPVLTGGPPPRGTLSWYHASRTFGGRNPLVPERLFADVDVVLVPVVAVSFNSTALQEALVPWLEAHWQRIDTPLWTLYLRP